MKIKTTKEKLDFLCSISECRPGPGGRKIYSVNLVFDVDGDILNIHETWVNRHYEGEAIIESEPYDSFDEAMANAYELPAYIETVRK